MSSFPDNGLSGSRTSHVPKFFWISSYLLSLRSHKLLVMVCCVTFYFPIFKYSQNTLEIAYRTTGYRTNLDIAQINLDISIGNETACGTYVLVGQISSGTEGCPISDPHWMSLN